MPVLARLQTIYRGMPYRSWIIGLILVNILALISVFFLKSFLPPVVPLFYGKPYGADQLAPQNFLLLAPFIALVICLVTTTINFIIKDEFLQKVLVGLMVICTVLALVTLLKIIFLVGSF